MYEDGTTSGGSDERIIKKISPARQLKLDARREDAIIWATPKRYPEFSPYMAISREITQKGLSINLKDAWFNMTPEEKVPLTTTHLKSQNAQYRVDLQAFNARIPLSPLVEIGNDSDSDDTSDSETNGMRSIGRHVVCQEKPGYGDCPDHPPSKQQLRNRRVAQLWNRYRRDHPEACGGAVTPVPEQPFRFLDMLPELRTAVYQLILLRPRALIQLEPDQSGPREIESGTDEDKGPVDVRIFVVCKQIYEEATTVFFGQNTFKIELIGEVYPNLPSPMFRTGFHPTNQDLISKLKKVELDLSPNRKCEWALKRVCKELADRASLVEMRINAHGSGDEGDDDKDREMDQILEIMTVVKGVGKVVFNDGTIVDVWDNVIPVRTLGTQAQRDRVSRIMTSSRCSTASVQTGQDQHRHGQD